MTSIKSLKDKNGNPFFPVTHMDAVFDSDGNSISDKLDIDETENTSYSMNSNGIKEFVCKKDSYIDNIYIEGKTMVNLFSYKQTYGSNDNSIWVHINPDFRVMTVGGRTYTLSNTTSKRIFVDIYSNDTNEYIRNLLIEGYSNLVETLGANEHYEKCTGMFSDGWTASDTTNINATLVIVEGDYADNEISYFSGINSIGQTGLTKLVNQNPDGNLTDSYMTIGGYSDSGVPTTATSCVRTVNPMYLANSQKTLYNWNSRSYNMLTYFYDSNMNFIDKYLFEVPERAKYAYFRTTAGSLQNYTSVREAVSYTPIENYVPSQIDKVELYNFPLRSLPDGTRDSIEKRGNDYYHIQRCYEFKYNNEDFSWFGTIGNGESYQLNISNLPGSDNWKPGYYGTMSCNIIQPYVAGEYPDTTDTSGFEGAFFVEDSKTLCIRLSNTKIDKTGTVEEYTARAKQYLMDNNCTFVLKLIRPIVTKIINLDLRTFKGNNELFIDNNGMPINVTFEVTNSVMSNDKVIKDKISALDDHSYYFEGVISDNINKINNNTNQINNNTNQITQLNDAIETVQLKKLTDASGAFIRLTNGTDIDTIYSGCNDILNATGTLPGSLVSTNNNILIECKRRSDSYVRQICYDVRSINSWERVRVNGTWSAWRSL